MLAALGLLGLSGVACDDPPAVSSPDAGRTSEKIEALRDRIDAQTVEMKDELQPILDDVSAPPPDAGASN